MRHVQPKRRGDAGWVLWMLAGRLDAATGCGYASIEQLRKDAGVKRDVILRALAWAQEAKVLEQARRGHRITADWAPASEWRLLLLPGAARSKPRQQASQGSSEATLAPDEWGDPWISQRRS